MWEGSAEVRSVDGSVTGGFRRVDVFAAAAIEFDGFLVGNVCEADGEERLGLAENTGTSAKVCSFVFLHLEVYAMRYKLSLKRDTTHHFCQPSRCYDPPCVNEAVQQTRLDVQ